MKQSNRLRPGTFYSVINMSNNLALSMPKSNKYIKDKPILQELDLENVNQMWMIEEVQPNKFEIVHAISTLVLENVVGTNHCRLEFGKQKSNQLYYLEPQHVEAIRKGDENLSRAQSEFMDKNKYQPPQKQRDFPKEQQESHRNLSERMEEGHDHKNRQESTFTRKTKKISPNFNLRPNAKIELKFRLKDREKSLKYLFCDKIEKKSELPQSFMMEYEMMENEKHQEKKKITRYSYSIKFMEIDISGYNEESLWHFVPISPKDNSFLGSTCHIMSYRSGYVLDVPEATDKKGVQIIQYPCNFRFNQKWIFKKVDEFNGYKYYFIINAQNGLYLDIKGESLKQGTPIIQWENHNGMNQIWRLEQQGRRVYLIRSALDKQLLLAVRDNSLKECAQICTSKISTECFWIIDGFISN